MKKKVVKYSMFSLFGSISLLAALFIAVLVLSFVSLETVSVERDDASGGTITYSYDADFDSSTPDKPSSATLYFVCFLWLFALLFGYICAKLIYVAYKYRVFLELNSEGFIYRGCFIPWDSIDSIYFLAMKNATIARIHFLHNVTLDWDWIFFKKKRSMQLDISLIFAKGRGKDVVELLNESLESYGNVKQQGVEPTKYEITALKSVGPFVFNTPRSDIQKSLDLQVKDTVTFKHNAHSFLVDDYGGIRAYYDKKDLLLLGVTFKPRKSLDLIFDDKNLSSMLGSKIHDFLSIHDINLIEDDEYFSFVSVKLGIGVCIDCNSDSISDDITVGTREYLERIFAAETKLR